MTAADRPGFGRCLDRLYATWGKPTPSERILGAAWDALEDFDLEIVEISAKALIAAGGKFLPSTSDLRDECRVQRKAAHASYTPTTMGEAVCDVCEGIGQVETRQEWYEAAPPGKPARQMLRHYWAPCGRCARGRRLADNRQRGASDVPARPQRQRGAA